MTTNRKWCVEWFYRVLCLLTLAKRHTLATATMATPRHAAARAGIFAESALIDKETGRIFWEGGNISTLSESLESRFGGLVHAKATLLSLLLWGAFYGWMAAWLRARLQALPIVQHLQANAPIPMAFCQFTLLGGAVPRVKPWVLTLVVLAYFLEAYFCSTHQFLAHRSDCQNVETFIEQLRQEIPQIAWKVRVFRYEPLFRSLWQDLRQGFDAMTQTKTFTSLGLPSPDIVAHDPQSVQTQQANDPAPFSSSPSSSSPQVFLGRKRILRQAKGNFDTCNSPWSAEWHDETRAGVWTRARGETAHAPLAKIHLTQLIVLGNDKARSEYFRQQGQFVSEHTRETSTAAEFATHIAVPGYKPRVLVTRQPSFGFSRRAFWFSTLLGLSVPYRIWMARHCDVIRVSLVKEIVLRSDKKKPARSWWSIYGSTDDEVVETTTAKPKSTDSSSSEAAFRNLMQQLDVYRPHSLLPAAATLPEQNATRVDQTSIVESSQTMAQANGTLQVESPISGEDTNSTIQIENMTNRKGATVMVVLDEENITNTTSTMATFALASTSPQVAEHELPEPNRITTEQPDFLPEDKAELVSTQEDTENQDNT